MSENKNATVTELLEELGNEPELESPLPASTQSNSTALIELRDVERTVRLPNDTDLVILKGVNFTVQQGEHIGIVGRSGTGKSTLLNILGLIDRPTSGEMFWRGNNVKNISSGRAAKIRGQDVGFVFQQFQLLAGRSAIENVAAPLLYGTLTDILQRKKLAYNALEQLGLRDRADADPRSLSGGEQQRVAIARALVRSPKLLLADEPTGALDLDTGNRVMELFTRVAAENGSALITITHDPKVAALADRQFELQGGRLHAITEEYDSDIARAVRSSAKQETGR